MRSFAIVMMLAACSRQEPPIVQRDPITPRAPESASMGPVVIEPKVPPFVTGMMDHADVFGWSSDESAFGYCETDGGMGARHCELIPRSGPKELFDDIDRTTHDLDPKLTAAIAARMAKLQLAVTPAQWKFHRDLEIVWQTISGDGTTKPAILRVGARAHGKSPAWVIELKGSTPYHGTIHPEAIAVSPDGELLGVISHAFGGEFSDELQAVVVPTAKIAAAAYEN